MHIFVYTSILHLFMHVYCIRLRLIIVIDIVVYTYCDNLISIIIFTRFGYYYYHDFVIAYYACFFSVLYTIIISEHSVIIIFLLLIVLPLSLASSLSLSYILMSYPPPPPPITRQTAMRSWHCVAHVNCKVLWHECIQGKR